MGQTFAEKIIARAAGRKSVNPGEIVTCNVDLAMIHDASGPRRVKPHLERLGVNVWDNERVVVIADHYTPVADASTAAILKLTREWIVEQGIARFHDGEGICHVLLVEKGYLRPGMFVVGGDSHSPTGGAIGCFIFGVGATDMAGILATGETWIRVPETMRIEWTGRLGRGVVAKDIMLHLCGALGMGGGEYQVMQFSGSAIESLVMDERMTLCNMTAELTAQTGLIVPDKITEAYLEKFGADVAEAAAWQPDADARYSATHVFDASQLAPQVAAPHSPANAAPVGEFSNDRIDQAYIGACTGSKLEDLHMAAELLSGRTVAKGVRLLVAPASKATTIRATHDGTLATLIDAGATLVATGCAACAGFGQGVLADGETCISSTSRNFQGRMGSPQAQVYLGSPYTVAAAAVTGRICDPREFLTQGSA